MGIASHALRLQALIETDAAMSLLRSDHAPIVVTVLQAHLGGEVRRRAVDEVIELVDGDLDELRDHFTLPQSAKAYCAEWRERGWLIRRPAPEARAETFELSPEAVRAVRLFEELERPRASATESRLMTIRGQVRRLALDTDPDGTRRAAALLEDRVQIDAQLEAIAAGAFEPIDAARATQRLHEILRLAEDVPSDFQRVRARFDRLNQELTASILSDEERQSAVLDAIFLGIDLIDQTDEGMSFAAFSALVLDAEQSASFEDDIARLLERDAMRMTPSQRRFLRRFLRGLKEHSREIHGVLSDFARGLRRYVQSQDFQSDRALRRQIRGALAEALATLGTWKPYRETSVILPLSSVAISSIGALTPHDPSDFEFDLHLDERLAGAASLEELVALARDTEIDFEELEQVVGAQLAERCGPLSVGELLCAWDASQGVASVVGLLTLAARHGTVVESLEPLSWTGADGVRRRALVRTHIFTERPAA